VTGHKHTLTKAMVRIIRLETIKCIGGGVQIGWAHVLMMHIWVVLGEIVGFVCGTRSPEDVILDLTNTVTNPIETHVNGFGSFLFDVVIGNASGCGVVSLN